MYHTDDENVKVRASDVTDGDDFYLSSSFFLFLSIPLPYSTVNPAGGDEGAAF